MQTFSNRKYKVLGFISDGLPGIGPIWILEDISKESSCNDNRKSNNNTTWNPSYIMTKEFKLAGPDQVYFYKSDGTVENRKHCLVECSSTF